MPWTIRVRKKFNAAHFLTDYRGSPEPLHGHTWEVEVFIDVDALDRGGVGVDFLEVEGYLEKILPDHRLLNEVFDFSPSAENLARWLYRKVKEAFPAVRKVVVWETEHCGAEYYEEDRHNHR
jgi:6-pyruvoyltetrahydropterin/6-carboxytetrahydropterin synthase